MDKIPALRISQGQSSEEGRSITIFVTAMTLGQLQKYTGVDDWNPSNPEGYQRPVVERRLREISKYVLEEKAVLPTSVLLGTRPGDGPRVQLEGFDNSNGAVSSNSSNRLTSD